MLESMNKRRKGYPSETYVKRGVRTINGKEFFSKSQAVKIYVPAVPVKSLRIVVSSQGVFDGSNRNHYFQGLK